MTDTDVLTDPALTMAYNAFMTIKHGKEPEKAPRFCWFDPGDDKADWNRGLTFVELPRDYVLKHNRGWIESLKVARTATKIPVKAGIYLDIGTSWAYIGAGPEEAVQYFESLTAELAVK